MTCPRLRTKLLGAVWLASMVSVGCDGCSQANDKALPAVASAKTTAPRLSVELTPEQRQRAERFRAVLRRGKPVSGSQCRDTRNYLPFLHLAATSRDDFVVTQSLACLEHAAPPSNRLDVAKEVIRYHLSKESERVRGAALHAARPLLGRNPDADLLADVVTVLRRKGASSALQAEVFKALHYVPTRAIKDEVLKRAADLASDDQSPAAFRAAALEFLLSLSPSALQRVVLPQSLLGAEDPALRALAVRTLARRHGDKLSAQLHALLSDRAAVVRASAAWMLGEVGDKAAIDGLIKLLDDDEAAAVTASHTSVMGIPLRVQGGWPTRPTPAVAAMLSIEELSESNLELEAFSGSLDTVAAKNRRKIRRWHATHRHH